MNLRLITLLVAVIVSGAGKYALGQTGSSDASFQNAADAAQRRLNESLAELSALRERIAEEKIPLSRQLVDLESELIEARQEYQRTARMLDTRTLDLSNLRGGVKVRIEEAAYLANLLQEYARNFESRLHIAEMQQHRERLNAVKLVAENPELGQSEAFELQAALVHDSLARIEGMLGVHRFAGSAVNSDGLIVPGEFLVVGPVAIFRSDAGEHVGTIKQRLGSLEPAVVAFSSPADREAAMRLFSGGPASAGEGAMMAGAFPFDPTLGDAHLVEAVNETLMEHIQKGGSVMIPIFVLAGAAFGVGLVKWIGLLFTRKPSKKRVDVLLHAVARRDKQAAHAAVARVRGAAGRMLAVGVDHLGEPRELIEEMMYETVLATRLKLQRWLPFIAISAAAAPLLGLLGTVTGIISTFKLITIFGTGNVKTLSGGISEALITTEFGLIVAIPSLLLHAFLSRKAKGITDSMEKTAVKFVNQVAKAYREEHAATQCVESIVDSELKKLKLMSSEQVREVLAEVMASAESRRSVQQEKRHDTVERQRAEQQKTSEEPVPTAAGR